MDRNQRPAGGRRCFEFLKRVHRPRLIEELGRESLRTVAAVLAHCDPVLSAQVLAGLPSSLQRGAVSAMKAARGLPQEVLEDLAATLRKRLAAPKTAPETPGRPAPGMIRYGGPAVAAAILGQASPEVRRNLQQNEPGLFRELTGMLFTFEDFLRTPPESLQTVFAEVETQTLALALKVATPALRKRILGSMSHRRADLITDELERRERVSLRQIEEARQAIVDRALDLQKQGRVLLDPDAETAE